MKLLAIGDIHGRSAWKSIVRSNAFDKVIFMGDYFDTFDPITPEEQLSNFLEIVRFKKQNPEKVVLLIGNHDFHYLPVALQAGIRYSGFQSPFAGVFSEVLARHLDQLQVTYLHEQILFTHAGVTHSWIKRTIKLNKYSAEKFSKVKLDSYINEVFKTTPKLFFFYGHDPNGNDVLQSPLWVRPQSLAEDPFGDFTQVIGHTSQRKIEVIDLANGKKAYLIDCLGNSEECLVLNNGIAGAV